ncbi:BRCA1-associated protein-like [Lucilia cuprina]|uniref:BRCA1-associated protein-like n=1 Tax=Lucilia cuprina TaxID=7375 RepID=UPI001F05B47A|nr:BRCA1-associated protein-like [Lucilia cuprina]
MDTSVEIFHANCLMTWNTYNCPVCYYIKNPDLMKNSACMSCDVNDSLWFCIVCAHVGCGQGIQGHALEHYTTTKHKYVMELPGFQVWDYKMEKFLHKLDAKDQRLDNFHSYYEQNGENTCSCPVCQHMRTPKFLKQPVCMECEEVQTPALWICLSCSHIGCGRHSNRHALLHFNKTKHPYSMCLNNFSIWDYKEHKYLHRQLHETVAMKSELVEFEGERVKEDFEKRMDRLEREWQEFSKLTEANEKMITIEERLLTLTDEKKILEEKLYEHDAKLNELLSQFAGNRENTSSPANTNTKAIEANNNTNDPMGSIKSEEQQKQDDVRISTFTGTSKNFISLIILGLFVYYFFRLFLQKLAECLVNLL